MFIVHETENEHIATSQQTTVLIGHPVENLVKRGSVHYAIQGGSNF